MADKNHPTIPQIVRALTTLDDRHRADMDQLTNAHDLELKRTGAALHGAGEIVVRRDEEINLLQQVIEGLCERIERTQRQLRNDMEMCALSDPGEIIDLLGRTTDPSAIIMKAQNKRAKAAEAAKQAAFNKGLRFRVTLANSAEQCPTTFPSDRCAGTKGHKGACTPNADDIPSQQEDEAVECDCGRSWPDGKMPPGHGDMQCTAVCRICGHDPERHTRSLLEDAYCTECFGDHEMDSSEPEDDDVCNACGHIRLDHQDQGRSGAQCMRCSSDYERSWRHEFVWRTTA